MIIRTNSFDSSLTINAPADTVKHFGRIGSLKIQAIKSKSHHEYGEVKYVEISSGRIAMENGSKVDHIHVNAKETTSVKPTEFNEVIISKATNVEMPNFSRDDVEIKAEGTLVVALQNGTEEVTETTDLDYVWLTKQGIYEQIKVSDNKTSTGSTWANDSSVAANTQEAAKQIANNIGRNEAGQVSEQTVVEDKTYNITVDPDTREIVVKDAETGTVAPTDVATQAKEQAVEVQPDKEDVQKGAIYFDGGTGTEKDPFLIVDYETFTNISKFYSEDYYFFKVKDGINQIALSDCTNVKLNGSFDGNNVTFVKVNQVVFHTVGTGSETDTKPINIKNFTVRFEGGDGVAYQNGAKTLNFDNINVTGYLLEDWNGAMFLRYGTANVVTGGFDYTVNFINCSSNAEIYSAQNGSSSTLVGHTYPGDGHFGTINVDTYTNEHISDVKLYYTGTGTKVGYKYFGIGNIDKVFVNGASVTSDDNKAPSANVIAIDSNKKPSKVDNGYSISTQSDTARVKVTLLWQYTEYTNNYGSKITDLSGVGGVCDSETFFEVSGSDTVKVFDRVTSVEIKTGSDRFDYALSNGKLTLYMQTTNQYIDGTVTLFVEQFTGGSNVAKYKGSLVIANKKQANDWVIA